MDEFVPKRFLEQVTGNRRTDRDVPRARIR